MMDGLSQEDLTLLLFYLISIYSKDKVIGSVSTDRKYI